MIEKLKVERAAMVDSALKISEIEAERDSAVADKAKAQADKDATEAKIRALDTLFEELRSENEELLEGIASAYRRLREEEQLRTSLLEDLHKQKTYTADELSLLIKKLHMDNSRLREDLQDKAVGLDSARSAHREAAIALDQFETGHVKVGEIQALLGSLKGLATEMMSSCKANNWPEDMLYPAVGIAELCQVAEHQLTPRLSPPREHEGQLPAETLAAPCVVPRLALPSHPDSQLGAGMDNGMTALFKKVGERLNELLERAGPLEPPTLSAAAPVEAVAEPRSEAKTPGGWFTPEAPVSEPRAGAEDAGSPNVQQSLLPEGVAMMLPEGAAMGGLVNQFY